MEKKNNGIYIPSIEASRVYEHNVRNKSATFEFKGLIPDSLELRKLKSQKVFSKYNSDESTKKKPKNTAVINVKFETTVKSGEYILESIPNRLIEKENELEELKKTIKDSKLLLKQYPNRKKLTDDIEKMEKKEHKLERTIKYYYDLKFDIETYYESKENDENHNSDKWEKVDTKDLRSKLYKEGFTIKQVDYETGEVTETFYKFYKRSSSKSRKGEAWFICEELYDVMVNWSRMNIPFVERQNVDLAGLMAYESLVTSSIIGTVEVDPKSILIVDEVINKFPETVNVVYKKDNHLDSKKDKITIENSIFDGEALVDESLFTGKFEGKGFLLLRSHMFKAAGFNTRLVQFYRDQFGEEYETATVEDMFGNQVKISEVRMVINPTCLKALKFSNVINDSDDKKESQNAMWQHWKRQLEQEEVMGVCKYEKGTKRGKLNDKPLQRTSYQMLNSLIDAEPKDIQKLVNVTEKDFIQSIKNDDEAFIQYLEDNANDINSNQMFVDLHRRIPNIVRTKMFRTFRSKTIGKYIEYVKKGKVRLVGDYVTMLSCGERYLYHSINEPIGDDRVLKGNEIHTTLFGEKGFNKSYVAFRNPHSSASNIYMCKNIRNSIIETYFNLTPNIVAVNSWGENIMNRLNGCDWDSDQIVLFDNNDLKRLVMESYNKYRVCVNDIDSDNTPYKLTPEDCANIDSKLSGSTVQIGFVTNVGQQVLSLISDKLKGGMKFEDEIIQKLIKKADVLTVLAGISIDSAKRQYAVKPNEQINHIIKELELNEIDVENASKEVKEYIDKELKEDEDKVFRGKPNFWKFVQDDRHIKNQKDEEKKPLMITHYNCPMDYLYDIKFARANSKDPIKLEELLILKDKRKGNRKQQKQLDELATESQNAISSTLMSGGDEDEVNVDLEDITEKFNEKFSKFKVNENTLYAILLQISEETEGDKKGKDKNNNCMRLMNHLYKSQKKVFLEAFKTSN